MRLINEFKEFAVKGNMFDMAVGIIIGTAFSKIVSSLVNDIIMPPLGYLVGGIEFSQMKYALKEAVKDESGKVVEESIMLNYGNFIQVSVDFLIIALTIFLVVKAINNLKRKSEDVEQKEVPTPKDVELLTEIRDLLKKR